MKFLVNAHLPRHLVQLLKDKGHDAIHTRDLPQANRTLDSEIRAISLREQRILITKDADFFRFLPVETRTIQVAADNDGQHHKQRAI